MPRIALVTGANRGLGLETCRQLVDKGFDVLLTARNESSGKAAADRVGGAFFPLDVTSEESVAALLRFVQQKWGNLDVLINNAGIVPGRTSTLEGTGDELQQGFQTNCVGPYLLCQAFFPLMKRQNYGRIVNISSGMGQLSQMQGGYAGYRISKTALNAVTRLFAFEAEGTDVLVNSVCPGWVKTEMGGPAAPRSLEEGVSGILWAATLPTGGPNGKFFRDGRELPW